MDTNGIGLYSAGLEREYLASPFKDKIITINARTPYDKVDEEAESKAFSREHFTPKAQSKMRVTIEAPEDNNSLDVLNKNNKNGNNNNSDNKNSNITTGTNKENANNYEVASFSKSSLSSKDIVNNALQGGYSADYAVNFTKAKNAYEKFLDTNPIDSLNTCSYRVF